MNPLKVLSVANGYIVSEGTHPEADARRTFVARSMDELHTLIEERAIETRTDLEPANGRAVQVEALARRLVAKRAKLRRPRGAGYDELDALLVELREALAESAEAAS